MSTEDYHDSLSKFLSLTIVLVFLQTEQCRFPSVEQTGPQLEDITYPIASRERERQRGKEREWDREWEKENYIIIRHRSKNRGE